MDNYDIEAYESCDYSVLNPSNSISAASASGGGVVIATTVLKFATEALKCYSEVKINSEIQATERMRIREGAKCIIAKIENDTRILQQALSESHERKMELIKIVGQLATKSEVDENTLKFCEYLLNCINSCDSTISLPNVEIPKLI